MEKFKVLITDHIAEEGIKILLDSKDIEVEEKPGISHEELKEIIGNYDAIITRSGTTITADLLENPGKLKIIGRAGVGLDNVDIEAASKKGIIVMNAPTGNTLAATELTMGMMLAAARKIPAAHISLKNGEWNRKKFMGIQLFNKTLGIVGLGRIGSNVAIRAKSFGMKIVAYDPYIKKSKAESLGVTLLDNLEDLLKISDVITFHTPLTKETKNMITKKEIELMKDGVILVNCARGGIINENDLYDALKSGKVFTAAIDVFEKEPPKGNKLLELDNLFVTPHIGANTEEGQKGVAVIIAEQIVNALHGKSYINAVNIPFMKSQLPEDLQIYFELIEKISKLAAQTVKGRPDEIKVTLVGKRFEDDICERTFDTPFSYQPFTIAAIKGFLEVRLQESVSYINAPYFAKDRKINVIESKQETYDKYNDLLILEIKTDKEHRIIAGTVFNNKEGRIVLFDDFRIDIIPEGTFLYFRNIDRPGVIGKVGTILGENNINIAGFELARQKGGEAIAFVSVDNEIPESVLSEIKKIDGMLEVNLVEL
ncbi:D-3-phosphoglycerate dehydrogenase [Deferribacter desulfuricans SSM1]|uniref:D-3-phosphoglycerate dehydrogenase n=1 Tax=Deferribacter desulfuricans (strain DSM 14783 / JCM 11476 / NBRC 101012 / SSM1) TaxID=639282 RepID=D3PCL0_DEFDS|nr:phosphoglycerate dehydrogenase [Deferribacter desulfuricans]BAI80333.1 D-3-phosphoglycerate dehydrogenase [Deferribacter desulfuricans SSM1]